MKTEHPKQVVVGVIAAMDEEVAELRHLAPTWETVDVRGLEFFRGVVTAATSSVTLVLVKSGVGKVLSAMVAERLIASFSPDYVLVTGIAGGLHPDLEIGDVILSQDTIQHDLDAQALGFPRGTIPYTELRELHASAELLRLGQLGAGNELIEGHQVHVGRILSGDQFITHREMASHNYLTEELGGDAIEMEGASVATVCHLNRVPFLIIRSISDRADGTAMTDFSRFMHVAAANSRKMVAHIVNSLQIG